MKSRVNALLRRHKQVLKEASLASDPEWVTFSRLPRPILPNRNPCAEIEIVFSGSVLRPAVDWENPVFIVGLSLAVNIKRVWVHAENLVNAGLVEADKAESEGRYGEAARLRGRARTGTRILAALEGQPRECQNEVCRQFGGKMTYQEYVDTFTEEQPKTWYWYSPPWQNGQSPEGKFAHVPCQGTGHNTKGEIRPPALSPKIRCRIADSTRAPDKREYPLATHTWWQLLSNHPDGLSWKGPTRIGPRDHGAWLRELNQPFGWTPRKLVAADPFDRAVVSLDQKISSRRVADSGKLKDLPRHIRNSPQGYYLEIREEAYQIPRDDPWPEEP